MNIKNNVTVNVVYVQKVIETEQETKPVEPPTNSTDNTALIITIAVSVAIISVLSICLIVKSRKHSKAKVNNSTKSCIPFSRERMIFPMECFEETLFWLLFMCVSNVINFGSLVIPNINYTKKTWKRQGYFR